MTPDSTSPVPAEASAGVPAMASSTRPDGSATAVVGPFSSAMAPDSAARRRAAATRSGPGGRPTRRSYSPSCGVSTTGADASSGRASRRPSTLSPSASTTTGHRRAGHQPPHLCPGALGPTQSGSDHHGAAPGRHLQGDLGPPVAGQVDPDGLGGRQVVEGRRPARRGGPSRTRPGRRPPRTAPRPRSCRASRRPPARRRPTCCRPGPGRGSQGGDVGVLDQGDAGRPRPAARCRPPAPSPASRTPSPWTRPGLRAAKVTVARGRQHRAAGRPGVAGHPRGDVHGQHRHARRPRAVRRRCRGSPVPKAASITRSTGGPSPPMASTSPGPTTVTRAPRRASSRGGHPAVGAVVALAGDRPPPGARRRRPAGRGRPRPPPSRPAPRAPRAGSWPAARASTRCISATVRTGCTTRPYRSVRTPDATTAARATRSVWVSERCHRVAPAARAARSAAPCSTSVGASSPVRDHLDVVEREGPEAEAERLQDGLLGGEAGGQAGHRVGHRSA